MKSMLITGIAIVMIILLILVFGFNTISERRRSEADWGVSDKYGTVNGTWGTEIIVEYEDGTIENLNNPLPTFDISFRDKKVDNFKYILSSRGTSIEYNAIQVDMSNFQIIITVETATNDRQTVFAEIVSEGLIELDMDGSWRNMYSVQVDTSELEILEEQGILEMNHSYNLSFTPTGSITYRGASAGEWTAVPLPNWFYLIFYVNGDADGEKWIEVEVSSQTPFNYK